jgi:hypothetical protein
MVGEVRVKGGLTGDGDMRRAATSDAETEAAARPRRRRAARRAAMVAWPAGELGIGVRACGRLVSLGVSLRGRREEAICL